MVITNLGPFGYDGVKSSHSQWNYRRPSLPLLPPRAMYSTESSAPDLGNLAKWYTLYCKFWRVLRQLGLWSHPLYLSEKAAQQVLVM